MNCFVLCVCVLCAYFLSRTITVMFVCDILGKDSVVPCVSLLSDEWYLTNQPLILRCNNVADKYLSDQINTSAKSRSTANRKKMRNSTSYLGSRWCSSAACSPL